MPASFARTSGANPVHPEMPTATLVPCAIAAFTVNTAMIAAATILVGVIFHPVFGNSERFMPAWGWREVKCINDASRWRTRKDLSYLPALPIRSFMKGKITAAGRQRVRRMRGYGIRERPYLAAVTIISTRQLRTRLARTQARTGAFCGLTQAFHTALCASKSRMSASQTWAVAVLGAEDQPETFGE